MSVFNNLYNSSVLENIPKEVLQAALNKMRNAKVNILVVGGTGVGKSSTINALFDMDIAKVGQGSTPETTEIRCFALDNLVIWDTPGLGDSTKNDQNYKRLISQKLKEKDKNGELLIDLVLLILDGASRDYGSAYTLIREVIIPNLGKDSNDRLLIAINQADVAMKGKHWDHENNEPKEKLIDFLEEKVKSTQKRIYDDTGIKVEVIYYSAGFKDEDEQQNPYNLAKLMDYIFRYIPSKKRISIINDLNKEKENFKHNDGREHYAENTKEKVENSFWENIQDFFANLENFINNNKEAIATVATTIVGAVSWFSSIFSKK